MIDDFLQLRNQVNKHKFRFDLDSGLWAAHYVSNEEMNSRNVVTIEKNGKLEGYLVFTFLTHEGMKACRILETCAKSREALAQMIDRIIDLSVKEKTDFIFAREYGEPFDDVFDKKNFASFVDCVIMSALLNPQKLLSSMSEQSARGKILKLIIQGFEPVVVEVGDGKLKVLDHKAADVTVMVDSKSFLELFFGKTSFWKGFLRRRISISNILRVPIALRFFDAIRQAQSYIPQGDWT